MCMGAIYWARLRKVYYANTREDAARIGFDDSFIYDQIGLAPGDRKVPMVQTMRGQALEAFREWEKSTLKVKY